jgi:hypothetical protein
MQVRPETLWHFLTNMDKDGRFIAWHPKDHIRFKVFKGNMGLKGSLFYFEENLGKMRFRMACRVANVIPLELIEYTTAKPLSWLKVGKAHFAITKHKENSITCEVFVQYGYSYTKVGRMVDRMIESFFIRKCDIEQHIEEEQQILKDLLEKQEKNA